MGKGTVEVDSKAIMDKFEELKLTSAEYRKSLRSAIRRALGILRNAVRRGAARVTSNSEKQRKGVNIVVYRNGAGGQVNIYKAFYLSSGKVFTLRWLERGTSDVTGRNGRKHGATPAKPFFNSSVSSASPAARSALSDEILSAIDKVASKRK